MKLANTDEKDMDTALHIGGLLNDLDDCNSPFRHCSIRTLESIDNPDAETEPENALEDFYPEDGEHCRLFVERLLKLLDRQPGCLNRVLWGFSTVRSNKVLDLESDHLALHPDLIAAQAKAETYDAMKDTLAWFIRQCQGDSGTGESYWEQFPEYQTAKTLLTPT